MTSLAVLNRFISFLHVTSTTIKARMSLNFKQNQHKTVKLTAIERLENPHKIPLEHRPHRLTMKYLL